MNNISTYRCRGCDAEHTEGMVVGPEKKGNLDRAMRREVREEFLRSRKNKMFGNEAAYEEMEDYILSNECVCDLRRLIKRDYYFDPPEHFKVPKNFSGRKRDIYTWHNNVKHLLSLIAFTLREKEHIYPDGLYSFRTSVSAKDFLRKLKTFENPEKYYIIRADISNYVASIVPELIIPKLSELWKDDPAFLDLLKFLLLRRECIERDGTLTACEPGGLGGIPLANHFMNVYLMEMDEYFEPRAPLYCRYSDDVIIFARTRREAEEYLEQVYKILKDKRLHTNPDKTHLLSLGEEVEILGFRFEGGKLDISNHAKKKLKRKLRVHAKKLIKYKAEKGLSSEEAGRLMVEYCQNVFFGRDSGNELSWSRWLFPVITEDTSLKELDRYSQDAIRMVMCGSFAKKRYRIRYEELKKLGYKSIVYAYYHFTEVSL